MNELLERIIGNEKSTLWMKEDNYRRVIFLTNHGSRAYGTSTPESDHDYRGITVPPREYFHGFVNKFEQIVRTSPVDAQVFDIRKFFNLAYQGNPNMLEILFTDPSDHIHVTKIGRELLDNKEIFISKAAKARFLGYAKQQAYKIKLHRRWHIEGVKEPPKRSDYGLSEKPFIEKQAKEVIYSQIQKKLDSWNLDFEPFSVSQKIYLNDKVADILSEMKLSADERWQSAARTFGLEENFIKNLIDERSFDSREEDYKNYLNWKKNRNPVRAAMEEKFGYDGKFALHLVRLLRMGLEILSGMGVIVRRPDAEELLEYRRGNKTYEQLMEYVANLESKIESEYIKSTLPKMPDSLKADQLCQRLVEMSFAEQTLTKTS